VAIIMLLAGPEIFAASEMLALVELFGAANFILLYVYALRSVAERWVTGFPELVRPLEADLLFIPSWRITAQMPSMLMHVVPWHTVALASAVLLSGIVAWHGIQLL
jgi:hypothetical protein